MASRARAVWSVDVRPLPQFAVGLGAAALAAFTTWELSRSFPDGIIFLFIYVPVIGAVGYFGGPIAGITTALVALAAAVNAVFGAVNLSWNVLGPMGAFTLMALITAFGAGRLRETERRAERARRRFLLMTEASELLSDLDYTKSLKNVAQLLIPVLGDWCIIELVEDGDLRTVALVHVDPNKTQDLEELYRAYPGTTGAGFSAQVTLRGETRRIANIGNATRESIAQDAHHLSLLRSVGTRALLRTSIVQGPQVYGALTLGRGNSSPRFDDADQLFAEDLGRRSGIAVALGISFARQRIIAGMLQRSLLPQELPDVPSARISARYVPAAAAEVGGDWYDVIPLPDGEIGLAVGDVAGRGLEAAVLMGQLRSSIEAIARELRAPAEVLQRLNDLLYRIPLRQMVTIVYMTISPRTRSVRFSSAGHPPPIVVNPRGTVQYLNEDGAMPLELAKAVAFKEADLVLPPESTLVLYTDGLIERRGTHIDQQYAVMEEVLSRGPTSPSAVCDRLIKEMAVTDQLVDDVAILAFQLQTVAAGELPGAKR